MARNTQFIRNLALAAAIALSATLFVGCTTTQKGAGVGAVAGGLAGGVIGHQSGNRTTGAIIGAGLGGITGAVVGEKMDQKYCPACGRRYGGSTTYCPSDGTPLRLIGG